MKPSQLIERAGYACSASPAPNRAMKIDHVDPETGIVVIRDPRRSPAPSDNKTPSEQNNGGHN